MDAVAEVRRAPVSFMQFKTTSVNYPCPPCLSSMIEPSCLNLLEGAAVLFTTGSVVEVLPLRAELGAPDTDPRPDSWIRGATD